MGFIKPDPMLIPRFNIDYTMTDFVHSLTNLNFETDISSIVKLFDNSSIEFTNSGRTSLYIILKALNLPSNSKIGVPLYCCPSIFEAIVRAGHKPLFLDIDPENYTLSPSFLEGKIDEVDAVIAIHTFGRPADLDKIQKIAGEKPVIEDCAHALLSRYKGKLVGTTSKASFFTFRTGKYISAGEGGMIVTGEQDFASKIKHEIENLPQPSLTDEIKHSTITFARSTLYKKPFFGLISLPLGELIENRIDLMNKYTFKMAQVRKTDLYVATKKLDGFEKKVEQQRNNSQYLINQLSDLGLKLPIETPNTYCNYYLFPLQFKSELQRDNMSISLRKKGIDTTKLFSKAPFIAQHYGYKGDCKNTEKISRSILTIPNFYVLKLKEINKVVNSLKVNLQEGEPFV